MRRQTACHHGHQDSMLAIAWAKILESHRGVQTPEAFLAYDKNPPQVGSAGARSIQELKLNTKYMKSW